ncbi:MAG: response regulator transcription factor [Oscillospiraceae bacterium]|nr:response regulator transcription factor [Oscillospiraceae bacterium]
MFYRIAVCDDEAEQIKIITDHLTRFSIKYGAEFNIERFSSGEALLKKYYNEPSPFDMIFLDVEMPGTGGIETAEKIRAIPDRNVLISFITSYPEYMQDSFDVQASQYLTKPVSYELFEAKLEKLIRYMGELEMNITVLSQRDGEIILHLDDIVSIEADKRSGLIFTTVREEISVKGKLSDYEKQLSDKYFISVHRSCLANMRYIRKFSADTLEFSTGKTVPVSRRRLSEIKEAFSKYMVMRYRR